MLLLLLVVLYPFVSFTLVPGIHDYLVKHSYANARSDDLWATLGSATGVDVGSLMDTWTRKVRRCDSPVYGLPEWML